jgi:hypothetical protein
MSNVTVTFYGICTHVNDVELTPPGDAFSPPDTETGFFARALAVNGRFGARLGGHRVPPHMQYLYVPTEFLVDQKPGDIPGLVRLPPDRDFGDVFWSMEGVSLYIANAKPGLEKTPGFLEIPRLRNVVGRNDLQVDGKIFNGRAAGVFEIYAGVLDGYRDPAADNAVVGQLKVTTADEGPELVVTRVWDDTQSRIRLKPDAYVFILNVGVETDKDTDFLLHYLATTWTPPDGVVPKPPPVPELREPNEEDGLRYLGRLPAGLTLGCSNSNYP